MRGLVKRLNRDLGYLKTVSTQKSIDAFDAQSLGLHIHNDFLTLYF